MLQFDAEKDWDDIKFGVDNQVDFYAVSFVKDAQVVHELKNYLKSMSCINMNNMLELHIFCLPFYNPFKFFLQAKVQIYMLL